jgi:predicted flap endonuclease-1-like 5' DNA nuclease
VTLNPYLLALIIFTAGILVGWVLPLPDLFSRKRGPTVEEKRAELISQQEEMMTLEARLAQSTQQLALLGQQARDLDIQRNDLIARLDEKRLQLQTLDQELTELDGRHESNLKRKETLLADIAKSIEELEQLTLMEQVYQGRITNMADQVEWQNGEIRMLQEAMRARTAEIERAQQTLDAQDSQHRDLYHTMRGADSPIPPRSKQAAPLPIIDAEPEELDGLVVNPEAEGHSQRRGAKQASSSRPIMLDPGGRPTPAEGRDDLTQLTGMGGSYARQLLTQGVSTFDQIAFSTVADLRRMLNIPGHLSPDIQRWIDEAREIITRRNEDEG